VIAAVAERPIRTYDVRPRILAGTAQIPGAIEVRAQDLRNRNFRAEMTVRESRNVIRPGRGPAPQLQPLAPGEQGRRAAQTHDPTIKSAYDAMARDWATLAEQAEWIEGQRRPPLSERAKPENR
jgi:hypothetical protein